MKKGILFLFILVTSFTLFAQAPGGDNCSSATLIPVTSSCNFVSYTTVGATSSPQATPGCSGYLGNDVWLKAVVPLSGHLQIRFQQVTSNMSWNVNKVDTCTVFTSLYCKTGNGFYNIHDSSLGGKEIYIRVWRLNSLSAGTFSICCWEPNIPDYDFCSGALPLTVGTVPNPITYPTFGATTESTSVVANPTCGFFQGNDLWFTAVVPSSGKIRIEWNSVSTMNVAAAFYSGTCGSLTQLNCVYSGADAINYNNVSLAGTTLYIRIWDANNAFTGGSFTLTAWEPNTPANDFCSQAIVIPVNTSCIPSVSYTNLGCTTESTAVAANPSCGFYQGGDIWFQLTIPASGKLRIEKNSTAGAMAFEVLTGTCGNFTPLSCVYSAGALNINQPALANQVLYIRCWYANSAVNIINFTLCAWEPNTPANDFCSQALALPVQSSCVPSITYSTVGCTTEPTTIAPTPSCGFFDGSDLWFSFVMPASGHVRVELNDGSPATFSLYTGSCGAMQEIVCSYPKDFGNIHNHALAGQTVYVRVWYTNSSFIPVNFTLCIWEPPTSEFDFCANALNIPVGTTCNPTTYNIIGATRETGVAPNPSCVTNYNADLWFSFTMPPSGLLRVTATGGTSSFQPQIALFSGTCGAMNQLACQISNNTTNTLNYVDSSRIGQTLYLQLWDHNYDGTTVNLCLFEPLCVIVVDSLQTVSSTCSSISDGSLSVYATCFSCAGNLEYALGNGSYQSSPVFNNISSGVYSVKVRDAANTSCSSPNTSVLVPTTGTSHYYFVDNDGDGFGFNSNPILSCTPVPGYVLQSGDCNDNNPGINPNALEIGCNGIDENCNSNLDDTPGEISITGQCNIIPNNQLVSYPNIPMGTYFDAIPVNSTSIKTFTLENTETLPLSIQSIQLTGSGATNFSISGITLPLQLNGNQSVSFQVSFTPTATATYQATIQVSNSDCDEALYSFSIQGIGTAATITSFEIKAFFEGYYLGNEMMQTALLNQGVPTCADVCDSVDIILHDASTLADVATFRGVLKTDGKIACRFVNLPTASYYIEVRHRNSIRAWSATPVPVVHNGSFHFSTSSTQAYGVNQHEVEPNVFALYTGDINQDDVVDAFDYLDLDLYLIVGAFGYLSADLTGDGVVDAFDYILLDTNLISGLGAITP
jgi:hypothetical protein